MTGSWAPRWMPRDSPEAKLLAAGYWWDAVRVPLDLGLHALRHLGDETGAVITDGYGRILYWLIRPGSAAGWSLAPVSVLTSGSHVVVPPLHRTTGPGPHWHVAPSRGCEWTSAARLHSALSTCLTTDACCPS
ncbi:hypothetical protein ACH4ZX_37270 [Streptomyces sp. NPDC020490]|uniref:hypothetical protein n=1 Tax=Streptomyces sp. NPDC020490 TaxID=3365078 RepID=UPI0037A72C0F